MEAPPETAVPNSPTSQHSKYSNSVLSANCATLTFSPPKKSKSYVQKLKSIYVKRPNDTIDIQQRVQQIDKSLKKQMALTLNIVEETN